MSKRKSQEEDSQAAGESSTASETPSTPPATDGGSAPSEAAPRTPDPDYKDLYLRALAELDNYRKVAARERRMVIDSAAESVLRKLLDPVDSLDRAVAEVERLEAQVAADLKPSVGRSVEGLQALRRKFHVLFESEGMVRISQPGSRFDPAIHEAIASIPTDEAEEGTVVEVVQPGYLLRDRLLRPARVAVAARKPAAQPHSSEVKPNKQEE